MDKCNGLAGRLFGHKFKARFDLGEPVITRINATSAKEATKVVESSKPKTYACDVCERCGKTIVRRRNDGR